jgi:hypothetical protein
MKSDYNPVTGKSPDDRPEDDAIYRWYGPDRAASGLICPLCWSMVPTYITAARGHMEWHLARGEGAAPS